MGALVLRPWTLKRADALAFVARTHRKQPKVQGAMWCVSVRAGSAVVGVALVGHAARVQTSDDYDMLCVLRVAVEDGYKNACSMLYGSCWRAARAMGCTSLVTYTHLDEPGTSLRAAGWIEDGITRGGEWDRPSRRRRKAVDAKPKRRWWAPGSLRAPQRKAVAA